jgi:hypothetical protein
VAKKRKRKAKPPTVEITRPPSREATSSDAIVLIGEFSSPTADLADRLIAAFRDSAGPNYDGAEAWVMMSLAEVKRLIRRVLGIAKTKKGKR